MQKSHSFKLLLIVVISMCFRAPIFAQSYTVPSTGSPLRKSVLDIVRKEAEAHFGQKVSFTVDTFRVSEKWCLFVGFAKQPDGNDINYKMTPEYKKDPVGTQAGIDGGDGYGGVFALLEKSGLEWAVKKLSFDSGEVFWMECDKKFRVPAEMLKSGGDPKEMPKVVIKGFDVPPHCISPDGRYGVIVPSLNQYDKGKTRQNQLIEMSTGRVLGKIEAETYVEGSNRYAELQVMWSLDSTMLSWWTRAAKWGTGGCVLLKIRDGALAWQTDVLGAANDEVNKQLKTAKKDSEGVLDVEVASKDNLTLPMRYSVTFDSNPKAMEDQATVSASMQVSVGDDGKTEFSSFQIKAEPMKQVFAGERFPQTRTGIIELSEARRWTQEHLRFAINEMYARHDYYYTDDALRAQFERHPWYRPIRGLSMDRAEANFSRIEKQNLETLAAAKKEVSQPAKSQGTKSGPPNDIQSWDLARVRAEINAVYVRYGAEFGNREVQAWADRQAGYRRIPGRTLDEAEKVFSEADRNYIKALGARRDALRR